MARATRIALDMALEASKVLKPALGTAWQYAKIEMVPPMTLNFFHGPKGKILEDSISKTADNFIARIQNRIKEIEADRLKEIKRKEAAAKALLEKVKAEARKKAEEAKKQAESLAKQVKTKLAQKAQAASKVSSEAAKKATEVKDTITKKIETVGKRTPPKKRGRDNKKVLPRDKKK